MAGPWRVECTGQLSRADRHKVEGEVGKDQRQVEPEPQTQVPRRVKIAIEIGFERGASMTCPWKGSPCTVFAHWQTRATKAVFLLLSYNIAML